MLRTLVHATLAALFIVGTAIGVSAQETSAAQKEKDKKAAPAIVNLNVATSEELQGLPGIGAATATRIIEYRQKNGGFKKVEDLMNVRGVGEKTFLTLKPLITVAPPKGNG